MKLIDNNKQEVPVLQKSEDHIPDKIEKKYNSLIQHGPHNQRIYLMKIDHAFSAEDLKGLEKLAKDNRYTKIFTKIPSSYYLLFKKHRYSIEAEIPSYYKNGETALFMSRFLNGKRKKPQRKQIKGFFKILKLYKIDTFASSLPSDYTIRKAQTSDTGVMAEIFKKVFKTYPFPVHNPVYLRNTMRKNIQYFCVLKNRQIIGISSSETDPDNLSTEMTDFAILPEHRGNGLAFFLLKEMEREMIRKNYHTAYTIARMASPGMNLTFFKNGYDIHGTLINNTNIAGNMETMTVWSKELLPGR